MTKPYHLSQEQALEILKPLGFTPDPIKGAVFVPSNGRGSLSLDVLQTAFNAALDKVLGEPVATVYKSCDYDPSLGFSIPNGRLDIAAIKGMSDSGLTAGTKLYAPKELT